MNGDILYIISVIGMVAGPVLFILAWPMSEWVVKHEMRMEEKKKEVVVKKPSKAKKVDRSYGNPYLKKYYRALEKKDRDGMLAALEECKANCSGVNSWCLTEMFCPECPIAGMPVQSGRAGMEKS